MPRSRCNVMRTPAVSTLCDVNVLLALVTDRHAAHTAAVSWLNGVPAGDAAICRIAQTGLLRLLNNLEDLAPVARGRPDPFYPYRAIRS